MENRPHDYDYIMLCEESAKHWTVFDTLKIVVTRNKFGIIITKITVKILSKTSDERAHVKNSE